MKAQARAYPDGPVLHEWSNSNGRAVLAAGSVSLLVDDSAGWVWRVADYDIFLRDPAGHWERLDGGRIRVRRSSTDLADA